MEENKGEWAEVADEGIVPVEADDAPVTGETTGSEEPATDEGIDLEGGDEADATRDGGPEGRRDLKDIGAMPRKVDADSARS